MSSNKHNKKRNTAVLYNILIQELTKSIVKKDEKKRNNLLIVIKEHFKKGTILNKELRLYNTLLENEGIEQRLAERLIEETRQEHLYSINEKRLFSEQSKLINKINQMFGVEIYDNFIPNYKSLATVYQIFNGKLPIKKRLVLEQKIIGDMIKKEETAVVLEPIGNLAFKTFVKKFNEKYNKNLLTEQRQLLNKYIFSFNNNGVELKLFLNEEIGRLKNKLKESFENADIKDDGEIKNKINEVLNIVESFKERQSIDDALINQVMKIQELVKEIYVG